VVEDVAADYPSQQLIRSISSQRKSANNFCISRRGITVADFNGSFVVENTFLVEGFISFAHHTILSFGRHPAFANQVFIAGVVIQVRSRGYWLPLQPQRRTSPLDSLVKDQCLDIHLRYFSI
jgi:hypothetical protein